MLEYLFLNPLPGQFQPTSRASSPSSAVLTAGGGYRLPGDGTAINRVGSPCWSSSTAQAAAGPTVSAAKASAKTSWAHADQNAAFSAPLAVAIVSRVWVTRPGARSCWTWWPVSWAANTIHHGSVRQGRAAPPPGSAARGRTRRPPRPAGRADRLAPTAVASRRRRTGRRGTRGDRSVHRGRPPRTPRPSSSAPPRRRPAAPSGQCRLDAGRTCGVPRMDPRYDGQPHVGSSAPLVHDTAGLVGVDGGHVLLDRLQHPSGHPVEGHEVAREPRESRVGPAPPQPARDLCSQLPHSTPRHSDAFDRAHVRPWFANHARESAGTGHVIHRHCCTSRRMVTR